jgi:predicted metal-dependent phosphoesterase TrpH
MHNQPFDKPGQFYKGNIHTHSHFSDGHLPLDEVIQGYRDHGYDFVSITDHFLPQRHFQKFGPEATEFIGITDTAGYRTDNFTTILGAELHAHKLANGEIWHLVGVGLPLDFAHWDGVETGLELAKRANENGAFVAIAHPAWYALTIEDVLPMLPYAHAVEIYNHSCNIPDRANSWHFADVLLGQGHRFGVIATDDAHFSERAGAAGDAFGGWIHLKAESLEPDALLAALKAGHYYASTGPEIYDIRQEGDDLVIESTAAERIMISSTGAKYGLELGPNLTAARFPIAPWRKLGWCRMTVIDQYRQVAWSNPIFFA